MIAFLAGAVVGAAVFGFFLRNNPKWALKLGIVADRIVEIVDVNNAGEEKATKPKRTRTKKNS